MSNNLAFFVGKPPGLQQMKDDTIKLLGSFTIQSMIGRKLTFELWQESNCFSFNSSMKMKRSMV